MKRLAAIALLVALLVATPVAGEPTVHRLSPVEAAAAVAGGAERNRATEALALTGDAPSRAVHGEIGFGVGTGGGREAFGSVVAPLGETGTAAFSYDYSRGRYDYDAPYPYLYRYQRR